MKKFFNKIANAWRRLPRWSVMLIFLILGIGIGVGVFYGVWNYKMKSQNRFQIPTPVVQNTNQPPSNVVVPTSTITNQNTTSSEFGDWHDYTYGYFHYATSTPKTDGRAFNITVAWLKKPIELSPQEAEDLLAPLKLLKGTISEHVPSDASIFFQSLWKLGTIKGGEFSGADFYLLQVGEEGLGTTSYYAYIFLPKDGQLRAFGNDNTFLTDRMINLTNASINEKVPPDVLTYTNGKKIQRISSLIFWDSSHTYRFIDLKNTTFTKDVISKEGFQLLKQEGSAAVRAVILDDGQVWYYTSQIPGKQTGAEFFPDVIWNDSVKNTEPYRMTAMGGCGGTTEIPNTVDAQDVSTLSIVGKTGAGEPVYFPKNPKTNEFVQKAYDLWFLPEGQEKPGMDEFLKKFPHPIFLWQNALGDWVLGQHNSLQPQVECGKPVIYLYPTKTTNVSVKLPSFINVTVSDPSYPVRGWNVVAHPDGSLNYSDGIRPEAPAGGKTYGSLYWEGTGVNYQSPREGFVVKDGEQKTFLTDTLAKYGLNHKESQEFMDFWLPKMTGSPYYRISFLTDTWSKAAPLSVWPKPDTNIRIFMDWQKLSAPIKLAESKIATPVRTGFTLVEWGGLLYR